MQKEIRKLFLAPYDLMSRSWNAMHPITTNVRLYAAKMLSDCPVCHHGIFSVKNPIHMFMW